MKKKINKQLTGIAILAIVALGVGLFSGLKVTQPAMVKTVNQYLTEKQFYDYRILSSLGFEQEDVDFLAKQKDVRSVVLERSSPP